MSDALAEIDELMTEVENMVRDGEVAIVGVIRALGEFKVTMAQFSESDIWASEMLAIVRPLVAALKDRRRH
jgi:hypothetical protein